ncbi:hypothetical protein BDV12DRAFT_210630 [Aspergillus spectabilis]
MFDSLSSSKRSSRGGSFGYPPQSGPGYGYGPGPAPYHNGPPPPGPGYNYGPPPPAYNNYGPPHQQVPLPGHYSYLNNNSYGYNNNPPPPRTNGPSPVPSYGPGRGHSPNPSMNTFHQPPAPQTNEPKTFILRQSPQTHKIIIIHPSGVPTTAPPSYSLTSSPKTAKGDYALARGSDPNDPGALIGTVKSHTFSSKYDLVVRGTPCTLKESTMGDKYTIEIPQMGVYKWCTDSENLSSKMWLKDERKNVLVTYDKVRGEASSVSGWKKFVGGRDRSLTFHVPASEMFVEVMIVSIYAVKMAKEGAIETAGEIVGALAGA